MNPHSEVENKRSDRGLYGWPGLRPILMSRSLPWRAKWKLLAAKLGRKPREPSPIAIPMGEGRVYLNWSHAPDWNVFWSVFLKRQYHTSFLDAIVVDFGAHNGYFSAYAIQQRAKAVIAYEPNQANHSILAQTLGSFDSPTQTIVHEKAVSLDPGVKEFYCTDQSWSHSLLNRSDRNVVGVSSVEAVSFEQAMAEAVSLATGTSKLIVKLDVEGAECDIVLKSSAESFKRIDEMFIEHHHFASCECLQLIHRLQELGFSLATDVSLDPGKNTNFTVRRRSEKSN